MFWHYDSEYGKERKKYYLENAICKKQETLDENRSCIVSLSRPSLSKPCICKTSIMNKFVLHDKNKTTNSMQFFSELVGVSVCRLTTIFVILMA